MKPNPNGIFNDEGLDITGRITTDKTRFFISKDIATNIASHKRSYMYPAYNHKKELIGWCVPK